MVEIVLALIAFAGAALTTILTYRANKKERKELQANIEKIRAETRSQELDNDLKAMNVFNDMIVKPLKQDVKSLQNKITRLTNAIDKIPTCTYAADCPVSRELRAIAQADYTAGSGSGAGKQ